MGMLLLCLNANIIDWWMWLWKIMGARFFFYVVGFGEDGLMDFESGRWFGYPGWVLLGRQGLEWRAEGWDQGRYRRGCTLEDCEMVGIEDGMKDTSYSSQHLDYCATIIELKCNFHMPKV